MVMEWCEQRGGNTSRTEWEKYPMKVETKAPEECVDEREGGGEEGEGDEEEGNRDIFNVH